MEQEGRILTGRDFSSAEWKERMSASVGLAEEPEAQEALLNYIKNLGGVREDVFSYLMAPRFPDTASVAAAAPLLCYAAPVEWIALSVEALNRDQTAGVIYVNEIAEAYREGVSIEEAEGCLKKAKTAFEMCRYIRACIQELRAMLSRSGRGEPPAGAARNKRGEIPTSVTHDREGLSASMTRSDGEEPPASMTRSDGEELSASMTRSDMVDAVTAAVTAAMQKFIGVTDGKTGIYMAGTASVREELSVSMTRSNREELSASMTRSDGEELPASMTRSDREEEAPDFPDGTKAEKLLVTDLYEAEQKAGKRISFFQMLLSRHMKRAFLKLEKEAQETRLFEIMIGRRYGKEKIVAVRRLMNGGMSNEFIFSLLEADLSEEELTGLCETLLSEEGTEDSGGKEAGREEEHSEEDAK